VKFLGFVLSLPLVLGFFKFGKKKKEKPLKSTDEEARSGGSSVVEEYEKILASGDKRAILDVLERLSQDFEGWESGLYNELCSRLWELNLQYYELDSPSQEDWDIHMRVTSLFNYGDWYTLLSDFIEVLSNPSLPQPVRVDSITHIWRLAYRGKITPEDKPRVAETVEKCLGESDPAILSQAVLAASLLEMRETVDRLREIGETHTNDVLLYNTGVALVEMGEKESGRKILEKVAGMGGFQGEQAKRYLENI